MPLLVNQAGSLLGLSTSVESEDVESLVPLALSTSIGTVLSSSASVGKVSAEGDVVPFTLSTSIGRGLGVCSVLPLFRVDVVGGPGADAALAGVAGEAKAGDMA